MVDLSGGQDGPLEHAFSNSVFIVPGIIMTSLSDLAAINAWILYKEATGKQIRRKQFLFQSAEQLFTDYGVIRQKRSLENEAPQTSNIT